MHLKLFSNIYFCRKRRYQLDPIPRILGDHHCQDVLPEFISVMLGSRKGLRKSNFKRVHEFLQISSGLSSPASVLMSKLTQRFFRLVQSTAKLYKPFGYYYLIAEEFFIHERSTSTPKVAGTSIAKRGESETGTKAFSVSRIAGMHIIHFMACFLCTLCLISYYCGRLIGHLISNHHWQDDPWVGFCRCSPPPRRASCAPFSMTTRASTGLLLLCGLREWA